MAFKFCFSPSSLLLRASISFLVGSLFASAGPVIPYRILSQYREVADAAQCGGSVNLCESRCVSYFLGNCVKREQHCNYRTYNFDDWDKMILREALRKISGIIRDSDVRHYAWNMSPRVSTMIFCGASVSESWDDFEDLQWTAMWPTVNIRPYSVDPELSGRACVGNLESVNDSWNGEANIEINIRYLTSTWNDVSGSSTRRIHVVSDQVAGTILHEVLHQMGHRHSCTYEGRNIPPYGVSDSRGEAFFISRMGQGLREALDKNSYVRRLGEGFEGVSPQSDELDGLYFDAFNISEGEAETLEEDEMIWARRPLNATRYSSLDEALVTLTVQKESDPTLDDTFYNHTLIKGLEDIPSPTRHSGLDGDSVGTDPIFNGTAILAENPSCDDEVCQCRCVRVRVYDEDEDLMGERVEVYSIGSGDHGEVVKDSLDVTNNSSSGVMQAYYGGLFCAMVFANLAIAMVSNVL